MFVENTKGTNSKLNCGTFIGRAGPGEFQNVTPEFETNPVAKYAWAFTRLTEYKKDTAKYANGGVVLAGQDEIPKLRTLGQCEEILGQAAFRDQNTKVLKVYGHATTAGSRVGKIVPQSPGVVFVPNRAEAADGSSFVALNMGQWILSKEVKVEGKQMYECTGVLRAGFEVALDPQEKFLKPSNNPDANPVCLFTCKALHMKPGALAAL